jgi:hypothetical protein
MRNRRTTLALTSILALLALSPTAQAKLPDRFIGAISAGPGEGQLLGANRVAVNEATGDIYVAEASNNRIQRFGSSGEFELMWGRGVDDGTGVAQVCVSGCQAGSAGPAAGMFDVPAGIAVNSTSGHVYVRDYANLRVQEFDADGGFVRAWGWDVDAVGGGGAFEICTVTCQAGSAGDGAGQFGAGGPADADLAISPTTGDVYAADVANRRILRFEGDGDFVEAFGDESTFGFFSPRNLAVDSAGIVYANDTNVGGDSDDRLQRYDTTTSSFLPPIAAPPLLEDEIFALAVDGDSDHLFVKWRDGIREYAPEAGSLTLVETSTVNGNTGNAGLAVNSATEEILVLAHTEASAHGGAVSRGVLALDDDGAPGQSASPEPPIDLTAHSATLRATLNANGSLPVQYHFEYSKDGAAWFSAPANSAVSPGGTEPLTLEVAVAGLEANTTYQVRVVTRQAFTSAPALTSGELQFATPEVPPDVVTAGAQQISDTTAYITGVVNPNNLPTDYRFEWGETAAYGNVVPVPDGLVNGGQPMVVGEQLNGLKPETTYHYRVIAENDKGPADPQGEDRTFSTRESVEPPAGRAYEMVTPPEKVNRRTGAPALTPDLINNPALASADGEAVMLGFFAGILDPDEGTAFPHAGSSAYIHRDAEAGRWVSEGIANIPSEVTATGEPLLGTNGLSADLNVQVWWHNKQLYPSTSHLSTKIMSDVGSGGYLNSGWYDWIADPAIAEPIQNEGSNGEGALVDDEGDRQLRWIDKYRGLLGPGDPSLKQTAGAAIYIQEQPGSGPRHLVNECTTTQGQTQIPARVAGNAIGAQNCQAGSPTSKLGAVGGRRGRPQAAMSTDGKRVFFTSPDPEVAPDVCAIGTGAATSCPPQLFVRQYDGSGPGSTGTATVRWISRSQVAGTQSIDLLRSVSYEGASSDGRYVFFTTDAPLTDDDPNAGGSITAGPASPDSFDLYRYEMPAGEDGVAGTADDLVADPAGGELTRITGGLGGTADPNTNAAEGALRYLSNDGMRAYFVTRGKIDEAVADNSPPLGSSSGNVASGTAAASVTRNLYLYDEEKTGAARWKFVASLPYATATAEVDACATHFGVPDMSQMGSSSVTHRDSLERRGGTSCVRGTPDGGVIAFETGAQLTADDTDTVNDIYLYEADGDELVRVSAPPVGNAGYSCGSSPAEFCNADFGATAADRDLGLNGLAHYNLAVEPSGEVALFFESRLALIPEDTNGDRWDVYRWRNGGLDLISPGDSPHHSWYSGNSTDGEDVFFQTTRRIDPREIEDGDLDTYDARVGGGFPPPPAPPVPCDVLAGGCVPAPGGLPSPTMAPSAAFAGAGNLPGRQASRCASDAGKFARRAKALRRAARQAKAPSKARRLARRASGAAIQAKRESVRAKRCRARARRSAR